MTRRLVHSLVTVMVRAGLRTKAVPPEHWEGGPDFAVVLCPCGHRPHITAGDYPRRCECQRWFYHDGTDVFALNGPPAATV